MGDSVSLILSSSGFAMRSYEARDAENRNGLLLAARHQVSMPDCVLRLMINVAVLNPAFLGVFMGTTVISVLLALLAVKGWGTPSAPYFLAGAILYLVGTFLVTGLGNVPLNDQLAAISASDPEAASMWVHYLARWTQLNTIRTVAAVGATLMFTLGLLRSGSG